MDDDEIIKRLEREAANDPKIKGQIIKNNKIIPLTSSDVKIRKINLGGE